MLLKAEFTISAWCSIIHAPHPNEWVPNPVSDSCREMIERYNSLAVAYVCVTLSLSLG